MCIRLSKGPSWNNEVMSAKGCTLAGTIVGDGPGESERNESGEESMGMGSVSMPYGNAEIPSRPSYMDLVWKESS